MFFIVRVTVLIVGYELLECSFEVRLGCNVVGTRARMPGYLVMCVYVCNGGHEENYEKGCVNPSHLSLITLQRAPLSPDLKGKTHPVPPCYIWD